MDRTFNVGGHVSWTSEVGRIRGTIQNKISAPMKIKSYVAHASKEAPPYLVKSNTTGHLAMHTGSALGIIAARSC